MGVRLVFLPWRLALCQPYGIWLSRRSRNTPHQDGDPQSYGLRPYRSAHDAIPMTFLRFSRRGSPQGVLNGYL